MSGSSPQGAPRPLSPHLQVYRLPLTAITSILHRMTGALLAMGSVLVVVWLVAAASGEQAYNVVQGFAQSWPGLIVLFGWSAALFYHMCNGVRHLFWDMGYLFKKENARLSGIIVILIAAVLTAGAWYCAYNF